MSRVVCDPGCWVEEPCTDCPCIPFDPIVGHVCDLRPSWKRESAEGMKILTVEYRRLRSFGEYENETVGAVAEVPPTGVTPSMALDALKQWVDGQFGERQNARDAASRVHRAEVRLREVNGLLGEAEKRWAAAQKILAAAGVEVPRDYGAGDDGELGSLPF